MYLRDLLMLFRNKHLIKKLLKCSIHNMKVHTHIYSEKYENIVFNYF